MPILLADGAIMNLVEGSDESSVALEHGGRLITNEEACSIVEGQSREAFARTAEDEWRVSELPIALNNVTAIQFSDPNALPGTEAQWKSYWIKVRGWTDSNPDFPDASKRPVRPG